MHLVNNHILSDRHPIAPSTSLRGSSVQLADMKVPRAGFISHPVHASSDLERLEMLDLLYVKRNVKWKCL